MAGNKVDLNQDIWDDSALIESWNEALDEYKKYHSIARKGGTLQDLQDLEKESAEKLAQREAQLNNKRSAQAAAAAVKQEQNACASSLRREPPQDPNIIFQESKPTDIPQQHQSESDAPAVAMPSQAAAIPPEAVLGTMKDENMKKLLMSWYYAGYYTGLYEGQQQAQGRS